VIRPENALAALKALRKKLKVVHLSDVAAALKADEEDVGDALGKLQEGGRVVYYLQTGYDLLSPYKPGVTPQKRPAPKAEPETAAGDVAEDAGIGGRAVGARTLFPVSYQTIADYSAKKAERDKRSDESRKRTRERLRELAQESIPIPERRHLRTLDD